MMRTCAGLVVMASCVLAGCARQDTEDVHRPPLATSATTLPAGRTPTEIAALLVDPMTRVGGYYMGDRLGMNLDLTLLAGGGYSMNWHGCQGLYGAAVGRWRLEDDRLLLEPSDQQGTLAEKPIRVLHIRLLADDLYPPSVILIPDDGMAMFVQEGVRSDTCFHPGGRVVLEELRRE